MFKLNKGLEINQTNDEDDSANIKFALTSLGYYDDSDDGLSPYPTEKLFNSIKSFQKDNHLKVDGVIKPDGPTQKNIKDRLKESVEKAADYYDFVKNWKDMRESDTIHADKYFHCKANFEATQRGWNGDQTAQSLSDMREIYGQIKGDGLTDKTQDTIANAHGRQAARSGKYKTAEEACAIFRPKGLNEKY